MKKELKNPLDNPIRVIRVACCDECPLKGECSSWRKLTKSQRVTLSISTSAPFGYMLKDCQLDLESEDSDENQI